MNDTQTLAQRVDALEGKVSRELDYLVVKSRLQFRGGPRCVLPAFLEFSNACSGDGAAGRRARLFLENITGFVKGDALAGEVDPATSFETLFSSRGGMHAQSTPNVHAPGM